MLARKLFQKLLKIGSGNGNGNGNGYSSIHELQWKEGEGGERWGGGNPYAGGEIPPTIWHKDGGEIHPPGGISLPLRKKFTKKAWTFFISVNNVFYSHLPSLNSYIVDIGWVQKEKMGVLIHKIEKILKKRGGKKEKKYIFSFFKKKGLDCFFWTHPVCWAIQWGFQDYFWF